MRSIFFFNDTKNFFFLKKRENNLQTLRKCKHFKNKINLFTCEIESKNYVQETK